MRMSPLIRKRTTTPTCHSTSSLWVLVVVVALTHQHQQRYSGVYGTPATHESFSSSYPEGTSTGVNEQLIGTPSYHYTIAESEGDGWYATMRNEKGEPVYAIVGDDGTYVPTDQIVGQDPPLQESYMAEETPAAQEQKCMASAYCKWKLDNNGFTRTLPSHMKNLVIPFRFADHATTTTDDRFISELTLEQDLYNDGEFSVEDYFLKQSHGKFQLESTVAPWYTLSKSEAECADDQSGLSLGIMTCLEEALEQALAIIQLDEYDQDGDGKIDSLTFVHSGYGAEYGDQDEFSAHYLNRIWSHSWKLDLPEGHAHADTPYALHSAFHGIANAHVARVGIPVHEIAQMLGFPTTYGNYPGYGMGYYDIMSNPYGFDGTQYNCGNMAAPSKLHMGWATVQDVGEEGGEFTLATTSEGDAESATHVLKISHPYPQGEYLLVENRQPLGYDKGLRQGGVAIYHVDEAGGVTPGHAGQSNYPANGHHYRSSLVQADGEFELEKGDDYGDSFDLFHGAYVNGMTPTGPHVVQVEGEEIVHHGGEYPNTKSYQNGKVQNTGLHIQDISESAHDMTLTIVLKENAQE